MSNSFFDEVDILLDDWFEQGMFSGFSSVRIIAKKLREVYPHLSTDGAERLVYRWMDCAREMGDID